jgi:hypothetical protein
MVEISISAAADDETKLNELLSHIIKEITDKNYRLRELNNPRKVDLNWVYVDNGKYRWRRQDKS